MRMPNNSDDLAIVSPEVRNPSAPIPQSGSPSYIKPGTGGKMVLTADGRTIGPIGGELLRHALLRGGQIVGERPVETFQRKSQNGLNIE